MARVDANIFTSKSKKNYPNSLAITGDYFAVRNINKFTNNSKKLVDMLLKRCFLICDKFYLIIATFPLKLCAAELCVWKLFYFIFNSAKAFESKSSGDGKNPNKHKRSH